MVRVDLHVHTSGSFDCSVDPHFIVRRARQLGLGPVFLTDHNTISAAAAVQRRSPPGTVIVGEEILTKEGEIIGLFLRDCVSPATSAEEAVDEIRHQGGLVYLPHPLDPTRRSLSPEAIDRVASKVDVVEVFNGRSTSETNRNAALLCQTLGATAGAGSDAHTLPEIGAAIVQMQEFSGPADFRVKLAHSTIITRPSRLRLRLAASARVLGGHTGT